MKTERELRDEYRQLLLEGERRAARNRHRGPGGLLEFVRDFWGILEPQTVFVEGEALSAVCMHLEAVTHGRINRLLMNVPPGFMKSLLTDVFWPAWEWGPMGMPHLRYVAFSYAAGLTERDNGKFRDLILSPKYKDLYGRVFRPRKVGEVKITNDKTGSKLATSVGGIGTGERGDRIILDDPHNIKDGESDAVRGETVRWFRESLSNRLNDMDESAIIVIMQRVHEEDVSGTILGQGFSGYEHLMIPMEYDSSRHCTTSIGWSDWRTDDGDLAWPERFSPSVVGGLQTALGPYAYASQYQQSPQLRGGSIFKHEWWTLWEDERNRFPTFEFVLASADTAYTEKESNDPTGFTVWGVFREQGGAPRIMLVHAWRKHLELHGRYLPREPGEDEASYVRRTQPSWGLVEWIAHTCRRYKVDRVLVEGKASGLSVAQELRRLHGTEGWGIEVRTPDGDKVSRAHAVQPLFSQGLVYAPARDWADMVIDEMGSFPRGRYKDLTDSATQALKYLRDGGFIQHRHERDYIAEEAMRHTNMKHEPLYRT